MVSIGNKILNISDYTITERPDGMDALSFDISEDAAEYPLLQEEAILKEGETEYIIKKVQSKGNGTSKVDASINMDDWKAQIISYDSKTVKSMYYVLDAIKPTGWTIEDRTQATKNRLIQIKNATPCDILSECVSRYGWAIRIGHKKVTIVNPANYRYTGAFVIEGLNLQQMTYAGATSEFCTKLYAEGADGLTFASINAGKNYVEDYTYTSKVVCAYWKDERYKHADSLLEDARAKLAEMSRPVVEYKCKITDVAAIDATRTDLTLGLFTVVRLIDSTRGTNVDMQVVEYKRHPEQPEKNEITLSTKMAAIKGTLATISDAIAETDDATRSVVQVQFDKLREAIEEGSGMYTTIKTDAQGASIIYLHDANTLDTSQIIWTMTADGISVSIDGGQTITAGITASGTAVLTRIYAEGINADYITTGHIKADRLESGGGGNLYDTGCDTFEQITDNSLYITKSSTVQSATVTTETSYVGKKSAKITASGADAYIVLGSSLNNYGRIPVQGGKKYIVSAWMKASANNTAAQLYAMGTDTVANNATYKNYKKADITLTTEWQRAQFVYTASAGAPYIFIRVDNDGGSGAIVYVDAIQVEECTDDAQKASAFSPSGTTVINGSNIVTGTVTADNIRSGTVVTNSFEAQNIKMTGGSIDMTTSTDTYDAIVLNGPSTSASMTPFGITATQQLGDHELKIQANGIFKKAAGRTYVDLTTSGLACYGATDNDMHTFYDSEASFIKRGIFTSSVSAGGTISRKITVSKAAHGTSPCVVVTPVGSNVSAYVTSVVANGSNMDITISMKNNGTTTASISCYYMVL